MNSLILDFQNDINNSDIKIGDILRKALLIATKLNMDDFIGWINLELEGYGKKDDIPKYRIISGDLRLKNAYKKDIAVQMDSAEIYESIQSSPILKSIIEIEDVSYGDSNVILIPPIEKRNVIYKYFPEMRDYEIYLVFNNSQFKTIVDAIRTKLLKWSFKLEKDGIIGENSSFSNDELEIANKNNENYKFIITNSNAQFENNNTQPSKNQGLSDKLKDNDNSKINVIEDSLCFVLMPFDEKFDGIYDLIKEELDNFNLNIKRADDIYGPGIVIKSIFDSIQKSKFLIADLTGCNANVFYELGYAAALDKKVILITQDELKNMPFDVLGWRTIQYSDSIKGFKHFKKELNSYIENL